MRRLLVALILVASGFFPLRGQVVRKGTIFLEYAPVARWDDPAVRYRMRSAELWGWQVVEVFEDTGIEEFILGRLERGALQIVESGEIFLADEPVRFPTPEELEPMWGLRNVGQAVGSVACARVGASLPGWDIGGGDVSSWFGCGVTVLLPDTGLDGRHRELRHALWGVHWTPRGEVQIPGDDLGLPHGTHVAGTIVAAVDGVAPVGVAPCAKVVSLDVFDGRRTTVARVLVALDWALENIRLGRLGRVVAMNASWVGRGVEAVQFPLKRAFRGLGNLDVVLVVGAGNTGRELDAQDFPASWSDIPELVTVGAYGPDGKLACFSNYHKELVHVGAPGVGILSTVAGGGVAWWDGTSMATPHVVGVVAVLRSVFPELRAREVRRILVESSKKSPFVEGKGFLGGMVDLRGALDHVGLRSR